MRSRPNANLSGRRRLLESTRGKLLLLLCGGPQTVNDLARRLRLTDNAVRAQLQRLQREGYVEHVGSRQGVRRPHAEYELAPKARMLFPRAYEPVLHKLVDVLKEQLPPDRRRQVLLEAGRRVLRLFVGELDTIPQDERLNRLMEKLGGRGAGIELVRENGRALVRACSCPLASVTAENEACCEIVATLVGELLGQPVREVCDRGEFPRCRFELSSSGSGPL